MTLPLFQNLNKQVIQYLLPAAVKIELPFAAPLHRLLSRMPNATLHCTCCDWKGHPRGARKHYLVVATIVEQELFCPACNHYLGFVTEPKD